MQKNVSLILAAVAALSLSVSTSRGQWLAAPVDGVYSNTANWTSGTINGTFGNSSITTISVPTNRTENLTFNGTTSAYTFSGAGAFTFGNGGGINVTNTVTANQNISNNLSQTTTNTIRTVFLAANALGGSTLTLGGNYSGGSNTAGLTTNVRFTGVAGGYGIMNGVISDGILGGALFVQKTGGAGNGGTWELNGANTYTAGTELSNGSGTFVLGNKAALGTGALRLSGGTISSNTNLSGANAIANNVIYQGTLNGTATTTTAVFNFTAGSNTATLTSGASPAIGDVISGGNGLNYLPFYTRVTSVSGATVTFDNNAAVTVVSSPAITTTPFAGSGTSTINITGSNNLEFSGSQNLSSVYGNLGAVTQTYNVTNTGSTIFSGILQQQAGAGVAGIVKTGAGVLTLSGANTYTGTTAVNGGTLLVNNTAGSGTGAGAVSVASTATLGGSGIIGGGVTTSAGSFLASGTTAGSTAVLALSSSLTLGGTTTFDLNGGIIRGTNYDGINVAGALTNGGALVFNISTGLGNSTYDLFSLATQSGNFSSVSLTGAGYTPGSFTNSLGTWSYTSGSTTFTYVQSTGDLTVIPEPSSWAVIVGGLGGLLCLHRLRRRQS